MNTEKRILFGVDHSEFAIQAVAAVGGLLKNSQNYRITLFYGAHDPNLPFFSKALGLGPKELQQLEKVCSLEETNVLEQAKKALTDSGFDSHRGSMHFCWNIRMRWLQLTLPLPYPPGCAHSEIS